MKIQYLGHSSFLLTTNAGTRIVTDPYDPSMYPGTLTYRAFDEEADIVTISHEHRDHSAMHKVKGKPIIIRGDGKFAASEVCFLGVQTFHDESHGAERGKNTAFVISVDDLRIVHLGDLGHVLTADQAAEIGAVDIALIPVGGYYTIDAKQADEVVKQLEARVIIPMHYSNDKCKFPIAGVNAFIENKSNVTRQKISEISLSKDNLPSTPEIIVLENSL